MPARTAFFVRLAAGLLVTTTLIVATGFYMKTRSGPVAQNDNVDPVAAPLPSNQEPISAAPAAEPKIGGEPLFARWPKDKPDVVIVFTGQTKGYLQPCGCSKPQLGGLERRFNFVESLKAKGWPVVGLDLGDMTAPNDPNGQRTVLDQTYKKYEYNMKALKEMDYAAVGVGEHDFSAQLIQLLGRFTLSNDGKPPYLLAGNLVGGVERDAQGKPIKYESREKYFNAGEGKRPMIEAYEIITKAKAVPIGVVGTVGPSVAKKVVQVDKELDFGLNSDLLKSALKAMNASPNKPELKVLLYQGTPDEAKAIAEDFSEFQVIVCLSEEAEPPSAPIELLNQKTQAKTLILQLGHKGRYVGVLGAFKTKDGLELKYQLVPLGEEYLTPETPEAEKNNKVLQLLESYAADVKREDLLSLYTKNRPQHALQIEHAKEHEITYVGSEACMKCHAAEYAVWKNTKHAKAYEALEKLAKRPSMQQFNGECVTCHTTGFNYKSGFENKEKTPLLVHNGCENCHGPGSAHAKDPKNKTFVAATIPWRFTDKDKLPSKEFMDKMGKLDGIARGKIEVDARTQRVVNEISRMCVKCHDSENDPKFDFYKYMPQIYHSGLKNQGLPTGIGK